MFKKKQSIGKEFYSVLHFCSSLANLLPSFLQQLAFERTLLFHSALVCAFTCEAQVANLALQRSHTYAVPHPLPNKGDKQMYIWSFKREVAVTDSSC